MEENNGLFFFPFTAAAGNPFAWCVRPAFHIAVTFPLFNTRINSSQQITANVKLVWIGGEKKQRAECKTCSGNRQYGCLIVSLCMLHVLFRAEGSWTHYLCVKITWKLQQWLLPFIEFRPHGSGGSGVGVAAETSAINFIFAHFSCLPRPSPSRQTEIFFLAVYISYYLRGNGSFFILNTPFTISPCPPPPWSRLSPALFSIRCTLQIHTSFCLSFGPYSWLSPSRIAGL